MPNMLLDLAPLDLLLDLALRRVHADVEEGVGRGVGSIDDKRLAVISRIILVGGRADVEFTIVENATSHETNGVFDQLDFSSDLSEGLVPLRACAAREVGSESKHFF
jgi:hypothetical protein